MAIVKGEVEAVSTKFDKYSIMVGGNWYATKMEWAKVRPNKGDVVQFDNGGGKFLKNVKILSAGAGGSASGSSSSGSGSTSSGKTWNNLGVELGHASNVAKDITIAQFEKEKVGSDEFFKQWVENTEKVFRVMKMLRTKYEEEDKPAVVEEPTGLPEPIVLSGGIDKDIFG